MRSKGRDKADSTLDKESARQGREARGRTADTSETCFANK